jgi:hypothetical protein
MPMQSTRPRPLGELDGGGSRRARQLDRRQPPQGRGPTRTYLGNARLAGLARRPSLRPVPAQARMRLELLGGVAAPQPTCSPGLQPGRHAELDYERIVEVLEH